MSDDEQEEKEQKRNSPPISRRVKRDLERVASEVTLKKLKQVVKSRKQGIIKNAIAEINKWIASDSQYTAFSTVTIMSYEPGETSIIKFQVAKKWTLTYEFRKSDGKCSQATLAKVVSGSDADRYRWNFTYRKNGADKYEHVLECDYTGYYGGYQHAGESDKRKAKLAHMIEYVERFIEKDLLEDSRSVHASKSLVNAIIQKLRKEISDDTNRVDPPSDLEAYQKMFGKFSVPIGDYVWTLQLVRKKEEPLEGDVDDHRD